MMPGQRLLSIARLWLDEATMSRVLEPLVADWQVEHRAAAPGHRWWIALRAMAAVVSSLAIIALRGAVRQFATPPSMRPAVALTAAGIVTGAAVVAVSFAAGTTARLQPSTIGTTVLAIHAVLIWRRCGFATATPLATFTRCVALVAGVVVAIEGAHALVLLLPIAVALAATNLPGPSSEGRRVALAFGPLALLIVLNPAIDVGSWPRVWRDVAQVAWGCWCVVACSMDATRALPPAARPAR